MHHEYRRIPYMYKKYNNLLKIILHVTGAHNLSMFFLLKHLRKEVTVLLSKETCERRENSTLTAQIVQEGLYILIIFYII